MQHLFLLAAIPPVFISLPAHSEQVTYGPGPGGWIPSPNNYGDPPGELVSVISVPDSRFVISLDSVTLSFNPGHSYAGDLVVTLTSPDGFDVHLFARVLGDGTLNFGDSSKLRGPYTFVDIGGADFNEAAATTPFEGEIPSGIYNRSTVHPKWPPSNPPVPDYDSYDVFEGNNLFGDWVLTIHDYDSDGQGRLDSWYFTVTIPTPAALPIFVVFIVWPKRHRR